METTTDRRILDLHCDTVTRCLDNGLDFDSDELHLSIGRRPPGIRLCQAAAVFIPDRLRGRDAQDYFMRVWELYQRECRRREDALVPVQDLRYIPARLEERPVALFLTVEGGAALGGELAWVDRLWQLGVRMLTLTWNGANELGGGVADGGGLTDFGRQAIARMEELGMGVDVSHLSDEGFWQLCELAQKPFCASHSNARALCGHRRNLTDEMFREIARRGGVVGINYCRYFLTEEGEGANIEAILRHVHHFLELGGEDTLALGSDFDGTDLPDDLEGIWHLDRLTAALERSGLSEAVLEKLLFGNAFRYLSGLGSKA